MNAVNPVRARGAAPRGRSRFYAAALIFGLALLPRLEAAGRGLPYLYAWDEPAFSNIAFHIVESGDWNPHSFNYPTLPSYLLASADRLYLALGGRAGRSAPGSPAWRASAESEWNVPETHLALLHRQLTSVAGALTCALALFLGAGLGFPWAGVGAACWLALSPFLAEESAHASVDPWMALFALAAVLPLSGERITPRGLRLSAWLAGMAASCKYNGVLALLPALGLAGEAGRGSGRERMRLLGIAAAAFLLCSPFVLLDAATALRHISYEVFHYGVRGHSGQEYGRGFGNLLFYGGVLGRGLGPLAWLTLPGAAWLLWRGGRSRAVFLFPLGYLLLMSAQRAAFGRNMDAVFVFAALGALAPLEAKVRRGAGGTKRRALATAALALTLAGLAGQALALGRSRPGWHQVDSRTRVMGVVSQRMPGLRGAVARSLQVHGEDLAHSRSQWRVAGIDTILAWARSDRVDWLILPESQGAASIRFGEGVVQRPLARFGRSPLGAGPPRDPVLALWVR